MNQDDQGDINCPYCEYAIRVSELPENNKIRCPGCKKTIDDVQSRLIPLASAINSLPDKNTDKPEIIVENLIQENTVDKNELTQKMMDYLLMDDSELCKVTGTITPKDYKKSILLSLANFID